MDPELKTLLTVLIDKVEQIDTKVNVIEATLPTLATKADIARLENEQHEMKAEIREVKEEQRQMKEEQRQMKDEQRQMKDEQRQMKDEQRQMKELLGVVRLKEIGRLDGRIDQLAQDVALGRKPDAA